MSKINYFIFQIISQILGQAFLPRHENDGYKMPREDLLDENATGVDQFVNFLFGGESNIELNCNCNALMQ